MRIKEHHHGFTLAEIIMTLFIVGLVATAAVPVFTTKKVTPINADEQTVDTPWKPCTETSGLCTESNPVVIGCDKIACLDENSTAYVYKNAADLPSWTQYAANNYSLFDIIDTENKLIRVDSGYLQLMNTNFFFSKTIHRIKGGTDRNSPVSNVVVGNNKFNDVYNIEYLQHFHNNVVLGNDNTLNDSVQGSTVIGGKNVIESSAGNFVFGYDNIANKTFIVGYEYNSTNQPTWGDGKKGAVIIGNTTTKLSSDPNILYIGDYLMADRTSLRVKGDLDVSGTFTATGAYNISDERLKNVKGAYKKGLKEIKQINPVEFSYKSDKTHSLQVGVVAQDVEKIFPEAVSKMPSGYLAVDSAPMFFASMNALKEVNQKFKEETEKSTKLEAELSALEAELKELTSCKATGFLERLACLKADFVRFIKSIIVFGGSEVKNEKV